MNDVKTYIPFLFKSFFSDKDKKNSLSSFVNSAMNIEYVYLIVFGVSELLDINDKSETNKNSDTTLKIDKEGQDMKITFNHIKVDDI